MGSLRVLDDDAPSFRASRHKLVVNEVGKVPWRKQLQVLEDVISHVVNLLLVHASLSKISRASGNTLKVLSDQAFEAVALGLVLSLGRQSSRVKMDRPMAFVRWRMLAA